MTPTEFDAFSLAVDTATSVATILAVVLSYRAVYLAQRAVKVAERDALQTTTVNVRNALAELITAAGELEAPLMHLKAVDRFEKDWVEMDTEVYGRVARVQAMGTSLSLELQAMFSFAPRAWIQEQQDALLAWVRAFAQDAWFAPYSATAHRPEVSPIAYCSRLLESEGAMRDYVTWYFFQEGDDPTPGLPHPDGPQRAISFYEDALTVLVDGVAEAVSRAATLVAGVEDWDRAVPGTFFLPLDDFELLLVPEDVQPATWEVHQNDGRVHRGSTLARLIDEHYISEYECYCFDKHVALGRRQDTAVELLMKAQVRDLEDSGCTAEERSLAMQPKGRLLVDNHGDPVAAWDSSAPLWLLATHYAPHTAIPRPLGDNIHWVDPYTERSFLMSYGTLLKNGVVELA